MENKFSNTIVKALSYILVAALSCVVTIVLVLPTMKYYNSYVPLREPEGKVAQGAEKLAELLNVIDTAYIGDADPTVMTDAAETAKATGTISYEVLCAATRRAEMTYDDE